MRCPKCQTELPEGAKFCLECGANLRVTDSTFAGSSEPIKLNLIPEPERKHVTALFSDLTGYTSMTEKLDPEQVKEITSRIFTRVKEIVAKYEGFVERVMGDGCLAFFGIPRAHEDDPIRAVQAAIEIHELVKGLSPQYESQVGAPLTMHSGINTGLVVTADVNPEKGTHGVAGDAVNVASRLSGMAAPGEILVGSETVRRAERRFTFDDLGQKQAKGKAEPVRVFKVISTKSPATGIVIDRQVSSEMVGRDKELDRLELQVMKAINGEGSVVNVVGEAGIGKSRLIAELKKRDVMKRVTLLEGRAISIGKNLSFHPIIGLLKRWARIAENDTEARAFDKLEKAIRAVHPEEFNEILPFVAILMGMKLTGKHAERTKGVAGEGLEKLIFKNVRELVIKGSELRPTVVIMEDLHWADTSSTELLESLYRLAEKHRVAFINVFRPMYFESDDCEVTPMGERPPEYCVSIELRPLNRNDSETLINNMLEIERLPYSLKTQIVERSEGNPFFIEELIRSLIDERAIVRKKGLFEVTDKIESVVIPATINGVLTARIDKLEEKTKELVKVASIIGRSFFYRIIKDVAASIGDIDNRLTYLKNLQLIRQRTRMQELEYLFKHALVQEVAYETTLIKQRKILHNKVAQSIEMIFRERLYEFYGMLAYHYTKAENVKKAEEYMVKAGEESQRSSASREALYYYQEALRFLAENLRDGVDPEKRDMLETGIAMALYNRGKYVDAVQYFDKLLERRGRGSVRHPIIVGLKLIFNFVVIVANLYIPLRKRRVTPNKHDLEIMYLSNKLCEALLSVDTRRLFIESIVNLRTSRNWDVSKVPGALLYLSNASGLFSLSGMSFALSKKYLQSARLIVDDGNISGMIAYTGSIVLHNLFGGWWSAIEDVDEDLLRQALDKGQLFHGTSYIMLMCAFKTETGEFRQAESLLERLSKIGSDYDYDQAKSYHYHLSANLLFRMGRFWEAQKEACAAISFFERMGMEPHKIALYGFDAAMDMFLGRIGPATESLKQADALIPSQEFLYPNYMAPYLLGRALLDIHVFKSAIRLEDSSHFSKLNSKAEQSIKRAWNNSRKYAPYRTWIIRLMGDHYWLIGKQRKALKWWDKSINEGKRLGAKPDLSRTYFEVGKHLLEPNSKYKQLNGIDAKGYLEKAELLFEEMGLEDDLDELERMRIGLA